MHFNRPLTIIFFSCLFISIQSFGQEGEPAKLPERVAYDIIEEPAEFPGGIDSLMRFVKENLKYPDRAVKEKIQGKCYLQFVIQKNGWVSTIKVKKGVPNCPECDVEAVRVLKSMPRWKPGQLKGEDVESTFSIPISFKL